MMLFTAQPSAQPIDAAAIKAAVDLLELCGADTTLRRESKHSGGSWSGPCPRCGGNDRFVVRPLGRSAAMPPAWWCRSCHPEPGDVIEYIQWRDGVGFVEACDTLTGGRAPDPAWLAERAAGLAARVADSEAREAEHRAKARAHLQAAYAEQDLQASLRAHAEIVADLVAGGMSRLAIEQFGFGYARTAGDRPAVTIPWSRGGQVQALQYRLIGGAQGDKYRWAPGTSYHVWNGDVLDEPVADYVIAAEGAKKGGAAWSTGLCSVIAVQSKGSAAGAIRRERDRLAAFGRVFVILDPDGHREAVAAAREAGENARVVMLPAKLDDWLVSTGHDVDLLCQYLERGRPA